MLTASHPRRNGELLPALSKHQTCRSLPPFICWGRDFGLGTFHAASLFQTKKPTRFLVNLSHNIPLMYSTLRQAVENIKFYTEMRENFLIEIFIPLL